jgi:HlyD family secretion protein
MAKKKSKLRIFIIIFIILAFILIVFNLFFGKKGDDVIEVQVGKVEKRTIIQTVSAIGTIQPEIEVKISSETSGEIIYLGVEEGDTVRSGQLLVKIKPDIVQSQLNQYSAAAEAQKMEIDAADAEKVRAKADFERKTDLYKKEFISKQDYEQVKSNFQRAESNYNAALQRYKQSLAGLSQVRSSFSRTTILAPMNGVVTKKDIEIGEKVVGTAQMQGTEMMRVSDLNVMNAVVEVDENDIVLVSIGDTAMIEVDALRDEIIKGYVIEIGHSAITAGQGTQDQVKNFKVKIRILKPDPRLRPGMSCNVDIQTETRRNVLAVPIQAVTSRDTTIEDAPDVSEERGPRKKEEEKDKTFKKKPDPVVFIKDGNIARMIKVKTGISDKDYYEIISGLKEKQEIISGSFMTVSKLLKDSSKIKLEAFDKKKPGDVKDFKK